MSKMLGVNVVVWEAEKEEVACGFGRIRLDDDLERGEVAVGV